METFWKNINTQSLDSLKEKPSVYVRSLVLKKEWIKLLESIQDTRLTVFIVHYLKRHFVRVNIFNEMPSEQIITFLDFSNDSIRQQMLRILIERFDLLPVSEAVGSALLSHMSEHLWAYRFFREIISLQSTAVLKKHSKLG
jgi:hypothetical protein